MADKLLKPTHRMMSPISGNLDVQVITVPGNIFDLDTITLTRSPANNESILVSIDGIVQQPSTSYNILEDQLQFTENLPPNSTISIYYFNREYFYSGAVPNGSVSAASILDGSVSNTKILDSSVSRNKISFSAIDANRITSDAVEKRLVFNKIRETRSSTPTIGTYQIGDLVWNSSPTPGNYVGWICTASGTPGVWHAFGLIV